MAFNFLSSVGIINVNKVRQRLEARGRALQSADSVGAQRPRGARVTALAAVPGIGGEGYALAIAQVLIGRAGGVERDFAVLGEELAGALSRAAAGKGDPPRRKPSPAR